MFDWLLRLWRVLTEPTPDTWRWEEDDYGQVWIVENGRYRLATAEEFNKFQLDKNQW